MTNTHYFEWQPIRKYAEGIQPRTGKQWNCTPAWSMTAIQSEPATEIPHPTGEDVEEKKKQYVFWDRHIDPRHYIDYGFTTADRPRTQVPTEPDPDRAWEIMCERRDFYLAQEGLTIDSPAQDVARCLANSFRCDSHFATKPMCETYASSQRALTHPIDGLLFKSHCVGCATAFAAMANSCGLATRNMGVGAHWVAEVRIDGHWHYVENTGRHDKNKGLGAFFQSNHMEMSLNPTGDHGARTDVNNYPVGLWRRPNPQFHNFIGGSWQDIATLRLAANCVHALYPECDRHGVKGDSRNRLPLVRNHGFYYSGLHESYAEYSQNIRRAALPAPIHPFNPTLNFRDFLYHPFRPGQKLRHSVWLGPDLNELESLEVVLLFGASRQSDFSPDVGRSLFLRVGDLRKSLTELGAWPPVDDGSGTPVAVTVALPREALSGGVNWVVLEHEAATTYHMPCVPAALEPYEPPLFAETDPYLPAMPWRK